MGNFSRDTFDRLKHYVSVRLQQGVPLVDADWNEREDIHRYELQTFLKWFVGDGVPLGDQGFAIRMQAVDNDFEIQAGRCLVQGQDVLNEGPIAYSAQVLSDTAIATALGVDPVLALSTPTVDGDYTAYLDVWEREVLPGQIGDDPYVYDRNLINEDIGLPTCTRSKREWVVRVIEGLTPPSPVTGHAHYPLARIARRAGEARIYAQDISDRRRTGLKIGSYYDTQQIVRDAFGTGYTLDGDGEPDLKVSLRETINALLRGSVPRTANTALTTDTGQDSNPQAVVDTDGDLWVFWQSGRSGNYDIWCKRYNWASGSWGADTQLTTDTGQDSNPQAVVDPDGDLWVFWRSYRSANNDIWYKRYSRASGSWGVDSQLTTDTGHDYNPQPLVDADGDLWVFWHAYRGANYDIRYRRYSRASGSWGADSPLTTDTGQDYNSQALVDIDGDLWVFWYSNRSANNDIWYKRYSRTSSSWGADIQLTTDTGSDYEPQAVVDPDGDLWVFWQSNRSGNNDIWYKRYSWANSSWGADSQLTTDTSYDYTPQAVVDTAGDLWVFWYAYRNANYDIRYKRYSRASGSWGVDSQLTTDPRTDYVPQAVVDTAGDLWVFWNTNRSGNHDIWYSKLIPQI